MNPDRCVQDVKAIFQIITEHAAAVDRAGKPRPAKLTRWWSWLMMVGVWLVAIGLIVYNTLVSAHAYAAWASGALAVAVGGTAIMYASAVPMVIDVVRILKQPLTGHLYCVLRTLPEDARLTARLTGFDAHSLEVARCRLEIESPKSLSRLDLIGGDGGMKTSLLGMGVMLVALVVSYRAVDFSKLSFPVLSIFGLALVVAISIYAWHAKSGARRAAFYVGILSLATYLKEHAQASTNRFAPWKHQGKGVEKRQGGIKWSG